MKILFVCSSNVCRSPYAEFVFRKLVAGDAMLSSIGIEVKSAAVLNYTKTIFPKAIPALLDEGFSKEEILAHKPCFKWCDMLRFDEADVIIGMSRFHKTLTPIKCKKKFITLSEAAGDEYTPIPDPFLAKSQEEYNKAMAVIKAYLIKYKNNLKESLLKDKTQH